MKKALLLLVFLPLACQQAEPPKVESQKEGSPRKGGSLESIAPPDTLKPFKGQTEYSDSLTITVLNFPHFDLKLHGSFPVHQQGDTIVLKEQPGQYLYQRRFWLEADSQKTVKSYISIHESLEQVYAFQQDDPQRPQWDEWRQKQQKWQAWSAFKYLAPKENFRFPMLNRGHNQEPPAALYQDLALKDTFINIEGEMGGTQAEALFLGEPAAYYIREALMRFELYDHGLLEKEYFVLILFSYGC